jgi:hypothetical protein
MDQIFVPESADIRHGTEQGGSNGWADQDLGYYFLDATIRETERDGLIGVGFF